MICTETFVPAEWAKGRGLPDDIHVQCARTQGHPMAEDNDGHVGFMGDLILRW